MSILDSNITDNIIRKVINVLQEKCRAKNWASRNSIIKWILLWRLPVQNHSKPFITEKRRNKAKYLTWNFIRLKFVKETSMVNLVESLGYIKCYTARVAQDLLTAPAILSDTNVKICSWLRRPKPILKIRKKRHISLSRNITYWNGDKL